VDQRIDGNYHALKTHLRHDLFTLKTNTMKQLVTLFFMSGILVTGYSQRESPSDMAKDLPRIPVNIGTIAFPKTGSRPTTPPTSTSNTNQDYQRLIAEADASYGRREYDAAVAYYNMALERKNEQYPKDQLLRIEAEAARSQQDQADRTRQQEAERSRQQTIEQDRQLRTEAEQARVQQDQAEQARQQAAELERRRKHTVHFSGLVMDDRYAPGDGFSKINEEDSYSDFLPPGKYDTVAPYLVKSQAYTFDGIVVPPGTRIVIYKDLNCKGEVLLDVTGPAIVNNQIWENDSRYNNLDSKDFTPELQSTYPPTVRSWSKSNIHLWGQGSMEVIVL
jgi:tetratricopeptide (TPR) repeat protein